MTSNSLTIVITAHPDDESMFFVPTIVNLRQAPLVLWLLCLTTGDYNGLGETRRQELQVAGDLLGFDRVMVGNVLKDHPREAWSLPTAVDYLRTTLADNLQAARMQPSSITLITFDTDGVSGHRNHRDCYAAVQQWVASTTSKIPYEAWSLQTIHNPLTKYVPLYEWLMLIGYGLSCLTRRPWPPSSTTTPSTHVVVHRLHQPSRNWRAMAAHASQFVWYRRLFVVFSCYTYVNRLQRMSVKKPT